MEKKEAMKILKDFRDKSALFSVRTALDTVLPELKESEDEESKKWILEYLYDGLRKSDEQFKGHFKTAIAWLEKQGDDGWGEGDVVRHGSILALVTNGRNAIKSNLEQITIQYPDEWVKAHAKERKYFFKELEKQGEQKYIPKYKIGDYVKNTNYKGEPIYEIVYMDKECYICEYRGKERMGDKAVMHFSFDNPYLRLVQKPADKVEPKFNFKIGDWVIDKDDKGVFYTTRIEENFVTIADIDGDEYVHSPDFFEVYFRLWSIQDAKDGDVLASGHLVFIFKVIHGVWLNCHCSAHNDGSFIADSYDLMTNKYFSEVHPATKEQRDTLMKAMADAGYTFDFEKKELKKIVEPKFKVGDWVVSKTSNLVYHVDSILLPQSKCYYLSHDGCVVIVSFTDEQNYHLWTIADAKDGDVLATQGSVFIFKHLDKTGRSLCKSYCEVIDNSGLGLGFEFSINGVCPATKEQRDLLFAKMKEAGYEWDIEKKELKMIESFNEYEGLTDFEKTLADICSGWIGNEIGWKEYIKDNANVLLRIAFEKFKTVQDTSFK